MSNRKRIAKPELRNVAAILNRESQSGSAPSTQSIPVSKLRLPAKQPRRFFDSEKLLQLINSVREHGILEPLLVRPLQDDEYELVAGERRLRAARELGLDQVPVVVHDLSDQQALHVALMENLQREDLNPVEETEAVLELLAISLGCEQTTIISLIHQAYNAKQRDRRLNQNVLIQIEKIESLLGEIGRFNTGTFRSSRLPLLKLPDNILEALRKGAIEYTKAQAIARMKDESQREKLLNQVISENLSLSEIKTWIKNALPLRQESQGTEITQRWYKIGKLIQRSDVWGDTERRDRITKLLDELEVLTTLEDR